MNKIIHPLTQHLLQHGQRETYLTQRQTTALIRRFLQDKHIVLELDKKQDFLFELLVNIYSDRLVFLGCSLSHGSQHVAQFLPLSLGANVSANPLLDELEGSLVLGHFQQLHGSPLIWSKTTHLANHVSNKLAMFGQTPAPAAVFRSGHIFGDLMTFIKANSHWVANSHVCKG